MPIKRNYANIEGKKLNQSKHIRYSIFFITWNNNKYVTDITDLKFVEIETAAEKYFNSFMNNIADYIKIKVKDDTNEKIKAINTDCMFKISSEQRRFHAYMYVQVDYYTKLQLDIDRMRKEIATEIGGGYFNVIPSSDTTCSIANYIYKYNTDDFSAK